MIQYDNELSKRLGVFSKLQSNYKDLNNNQNKEEQQKNENYSLRPRSTRRKRLPDVEEDDEKTLISKTKKKDFKQKPAPLSKYRRKTANARERNRMREINRAFETLRKVVPQMTPRQQENEKLTKITTLKLAMEYISSLSEVLNKNKHRSLCELFNTDKSCLRLSENSHLNFLDGGDFESFLLESDGESLALQSDVSVTSSEFGVDLSSDSFGAGVLGFEPLTTDISENLTHIDIFLGSFS